MSDWQGTSRAWADTLNESSKCWGRRSEIALVVGFKFGSVILLAFDQSRANQVDALFCLKVLRGQSMGRCRFVRPIN